MDSRFRVGAHWAIRVRPTSVDPVKDSLRIRCDEVSAGPITRLSPVTTLNTPGGTPACSASSARARALKGVAEAGLSTTVQPAAKAGATLRVIMAAGKFHGVIAATGPTGCLRVRMRSRPVGLGITAPSSRSASEANHLRNWLA